jgi:hypothetical protein
MLLAFGIDLVILSVILYAAGYASQGIRTKRAYWVNLICIPLSVLLLLVSPYLIVAGVQHL